MKLALLLALIGATACGSSARFDPIALGDVPVGVQGICGNTEILGRSETPINEGACGISNPVRVYAVSGVRLNAQPVLNCRTARTLNEWVVEKAGPISASAGEQLSNLRVVASYACRTRNHQAGAKLSEHAKGNAIDIAEISFASGKSVSVLDDWGKGRDGQMLKAFHEGACGIFGTVLGPESDPFHRDHFHFDTAKHRSAYCR